MKLSKLALVAVIACGTYAGNVFADQTNDIQLVSHCDNACDCGAPVCGCDSACEAAAECCDAAPACDTGCEAAAGCDSACGGCDSACGGCDSACGCKKGCGLRGRMGGGRMCDLLGGKNCCLGDPYTLFGEHCGWSAGGWVQLGYTTDELPAFNTYDDVLQLQQGWLYAEKAVDGRCGLDIGGRIDYIYGTDGPNTQAFGTDPRGWDNDWDNGGQYGHAIPQLYGEVAYGDLSVKFGHFYTIIGYEVVPATGNFFYSHAYTFNFSEPFTHTGVLAQYDVNDCVTVWGGYTMGWDSGFDDNGDAFLGGISMDLTDRLNVTYASTGGRFAEPWSGAVPQAVSGYQHSIVSQYDVSDSLQYISQGDVLATNFADGTNARDTVGLNQYLIKTINDCWAVGARFEWWNVEDLGNADADIYALTLGVNHRPHANVIVRPEIRWDWNDDRATVAGNTLLEDNDDEQFTFGVDTILTF